MARGSGNSRFSALVLALVACPAALIGQSTTSSALTGTILDQNGKPIQGAVVRVTSESLIGGSRTAVSSENGRYRIPILPPGRYAMTVEAKGFPTRKAEEVAELGKTTVVDFRLSPEASAVVEVVGRSGAEEMVSTTTRNFKAEDIENLPIKRDIAAIAALTPGVNLTVSSGARVSASGFGGDRDNANAYLINGINVGDSSAGQAWVQVNPDWFEEVQIGGVGAGAEFGGFSGAYFNGMIKKGGNQFSGSLAGYYQKDSWSANRNVADPSLPDIIVRKVGDTASDLALNIGGPIIKDKLWYFFSIEAISIERTPVGSPVSEKRSTPRAMANVTLQATPTATLSLFLDYDTVQTDHRGASRTLAAEATRKQDGPNFTFGLEWLQALNSNMVLTLRASGYDGIDDHKAYNGESYSLYVDGGVPANAAIPGYAKYFGFDQMNNAYQSFENSRSRLGLLASLDWYIPAGNGSHALKFGLDIDRAKDKEKAWYPGGISLNAIADGDTVYTDYVQVGGGYDFDTKLERNTFYVQDVWTVNDQLILRPGLRFEEFKGGDLWKTTTLAPRFGFTWTPNASKTLALKGHIGRYYDGLSGANYDRAIPGAYPLEKRYWWPNYDDAQVLSLTNLGNPLADVPLPTFTPDNYRNGVSEQSTLDPNIKHPYFDEIQFAVEQRLGKNWTAAASYVRRNGKDLLARYDRLPLSASTTSVINPLTSQTLTFQRPGVNADGTHDYYITNDPDAKRTYSATTFSLDGRFTPNWDMSFSVTKASNKGNLLKSNGYSSGREWVGTMYNSDGYLPGFNDDELKLRTSYKAPWGTRFNASFVYLSGLHYTRYMQTSRLGNRERYYINIEPLGASTYDARRLLDLRVSHKFSLGGKRALELFGDVFNVLNDAAVTSRGERYGSAYYGMVLDQEPPRTFRLGAKLLF
ncbi:membrane protein [Geothrix oryzae]|uniref:Membrane protein n=1 Tax=Geothrix oryzae TaxID=2927975 RepID=A0ABM8DT36_9BACT|nr:TonB-dependent receptor [Geothrix oryzae]BDU70215.1 membrane protein [Geothrix oryzae]